MSQTLDAMFDGEVFRPAGAVEPQPNTRVKLIVTIKSALEETPASFLRAAHSLRLAGPSDWSSHVENYR